MWPRGDVVAGPGGDMTASRGKKAGLSGFVSFMKRKDAEKAVHDIDGFDWGGSILRVGWSKAVPLAPKATYVGECRRFYEWPCNYQPAIYVRTSFSQSPFEFAFTFARNL